MTDVPRARAQWLGEEVHDANWIAVYVDGNDANQFRLWVNILAAVWEGLRRRASPHERTMYAFIRDLVDASAQVDEGMIIEHCKELVLRLGGLCDPRRSCVHGQAHRGRSRGPADRASCP